MTAFSPPLTVPIHQSPEQKGFSHYIQKQQRAEKWIIKQAEHFFLRLCYLSENITSWKSEKEEKWQEMTNGCDSVKAKNF